MLLGAPGQSGLDQLDSRGPHTSLSRLCLCVGRQFYVSIEVRRCRECVQLWALNAMFISAAGWSVERLSHRPGTFCQAWMDSCLAEPTPMPLDLTHRDIHPRVGVEEEAGSMVLGTG